MVLVIYHPTLRVYFPFVAFSFGSSVRAGGRVCVLYMCIKYYYAAPSGISTQLKNRGKPFGERTRVIRIVA